MPYDKNKHHRRSIRLKEYDYASPGWYYITICTHDRECMFGDVIEGTMILNAFGKLVEFTWYDLPNHNTNVDLDQFIVMPNHVHGIIILNDVHHAVGAGSEPAPTMEPAHTGADTPNIKPQSNNNSKPHGLPEIVRQFKTFSARRINQKREMTGFPVWQRNYYEHIIRNDRDLYEIQNYIINNPLKWELDNEHPDNWRANNGK